MVWNDDSYADVEDNDNMILQNAVDADIESVREMKDDASKVQAARIRGCSFTRWHSGSDQQNGGGGDNTEVERILRDSQR